MLLATALALLTPRDVLSRRLLFQNKPAAVAPKETITHHFFVSGIGQKAVMQPKFVAAQKMLLKQKPKQTFVNGLLGFFTHYLNVTPLERVCIAHNNCTRLPIDIGNSIYTAH